MTYQLETLRAVQLSDKQSLVFTDLLENGPATRHQIAARSGLTLQCVCGRVGELLDRGMVFTADRPGDRQLVAADPKQENWQDRMQDFARTKQLARIQDFASDFEPYLDETTREGLRRVYRMVNVRPL